MLLTHMPPPPLPPPQVQHLSVLEYFTQHQRREPIVVATSIGVALDYGRILLQVGMSHEQGMS